MNQVEIWLSILVRKLLKRGNFTSLDDLRDQIMAFIDYYNRTMAKPIKWTYTGMTPCRNMLDVDRRFGGRIALLVFPRMFIAQTLGSGTAVFGSKSFLKEWIAGL